ncbi:hypothetical protein BD626DRAFT_491699 [Schizophyllum amplum]|uniref:Uncharacterized protein n=1 Tax=Schizophyllum amplum TaxID=97359 RepID=A0A550CHX1_9AGAR|nr:hypothetical protein BD626DRAFT_491699 [Auriculariopsis ampla]
MLEGKHARDVVIPVGRAILKALVQVGCRDRSVGRILQPPRRYDEAQTFRGVVVVSGEEFPVHEGDAIRRTQEVERMIMSGRHFNRLPRAVDVVQDSGIRVGKHRQSVIDRRVDEGPLREVLRRIRPIMSVKVRNLPLHRSSLVVHVRREVHLCLQQRGTRAQAEDRDMGDHHRSRAVEEHWFARVSGPR